MLGRVAEEPARPPEAGVREGDVDPSKGLKRGGRQLLLLLPAGHIAAHSERALASAELMREIVQALLAAGGEHQTTSGGGGAAGGGGAYSG